MAVVAPDQLLCGQWDKYFTPEFTFSNNAWGKDASGGSCLNVTSNASTIATTWLWTNTTSKTSVHAFPNLLLNSIQQSPIHLSNLTSLTAHVDWHMGPSTMPSSSTFETVALEKLNATANVAFDMFLDPDVGKAKDTVGPGYEVMVWLGTVGETFPIGFFNGSLPRPGVKMGGSDFTLYNGINSIGQQVFSWVANTNLTSFTGDLAVGIHYLTDNNLLPKENYLGVVQFGTETFHASEYVTFTATGMSFDVERSDGVGKGKKGSGVKSAAAAGGRRRRGMGIGGCCVAVMVMVATILY